ncbi:MAG TPA: alanine racemase, partial [Clostridiaceae bacterium]|nr:alanine racemase [Clostridiaceae bacterium]
NFYLEVNLDNINYNINKIKEKTSKKIMAVVKADAYGLGIEKVTEFLSDKVDAFAVINMEEALKVKSEKDVLILTPELSREDIELIKDNFIITIDNEELLKKI